MLSYSSIGDETNHFLRGGCVVWLQHTELGGFVTSDELDFTNDGLAEVYVRKNKHTDEDKAQSGDLFEIEIADNNNRGREISKSEMQIKGGENFTYRLRHLNTGRLIGV